MALTSRQRALLSSRAQALKPQFQIGKDGLSERSVAALEQALSARDLVKVKVLDTAAISARDAALEMETLLHPVEIVRVIGNTIVLFRPAAVME